MRKKSIIRSDIVKDKLIKQGRKKIRYFSQPEILVAIVIKKKKSYMVAIIHVTPEFRLMKVISFVKGN